MRPRLSPIALLVALLTACQAPGEGEVPAPSPRPPLHVVAATSAGLAVIDAHTRRPVQTWGTRPVLDVTVEPGSGEVLSFEIDPREEGGWIVAHVPSVGETGRWFVDGDVRLVPAAVGLLSLERSYGERWRLLRAAPSPSWPAPLPSSLVLAADRRVAYALTDGGTVLRTVSLGPPLFEQAHASLSPPLHPTAQVLDAGRVLDVVDGGLAVRTIDRGRVRTERRYDVVGPIVAAQQDGDQVVALLDAPLRLVVLTDRASTLALPGGPCGGAIECRALVVAPPYVVVGTREALHVARMSADLRLVLEGSTTIAHGPVAGPWPEP